MKINKLLSLFLGLILIQSVNAFSFDFLGYKVTYDTTTVFIDNLNESIIKEDPEIIIFPDSHEFDNYIQQANSDPETTEFLNDLGYTQVAVIDIETNKAYTIFISNGKITEVWNGHFEPEVTIKVQRTKLENAYLNENYESITDYIEFPFSLKLKLLFRGIL